MEDSILKRQVYSFCENFHRFDLLFTVAPMVRDFWDPLITKAKHLDENDPYAKFIDEYILYIPEWVWNLAELYRNQFLPQQKGMWDGDPQAEAKLASFLKRFVEEDPKWRERAVGIQNFRSQFKEHKHPEEYRVLASQDKSVVIGALNRSISKLITRDSRNVEKVAMGILSGTRMSMSDYFKSTKTASHKPVWELLIYIYPMIEMIRQSGEGSVSLLHDLIGEAIPDYLERSEDNTRKLCSKIGLKFRERGRPEK